MTTGANRILDDFAKLMTDAAGAAQGVRKEAETVFRAQAERFGAVLISDDVTSVQLDGEVKIVRDSDDVEYHAKAVILAMGSGYRKLGLADEERLSGRGVSWCATCDGAFFRDKPIAVIGGGDSAMEEATFLSRFGTKVVVVHRRDELRAKADPQHGLSRARHVPHIPLFRREPAEFRLVIDAHGAAHDNKHVHGFSGGRLPARIQRRRRHGVPGGPQA